MRALCTKKCFDGAQLYEEGTEYEIPKGLEMHFAKPVRVKSPDKEPETKPVKDKFEESEK